MPNQYKSKSERVGNKKKRSQNAVSRFVDCHTESANPFPFPTACFCRLADARAIIAQMRGKVGGCGKRG
jgi:hypothetical protein